MEHGENDWRFLAFKCATEQPAEPLGDLDLKKSLVSH